MSTRLPEHEVIKVYTALVRDSEDICNLTRGTLDGCLRMIIQYVKSHHDNFTLVKMPQMCSDLDRALGSYWIPDLHTDRLIYRDGKPRFLLPLFDLIFDPYGNPRLEAAPAVQCFRQITKIFKKYRTQCPKERITDAESEFISIEHKLVEPRLSWGADDLDYGSHYPHLMDVGSRVLGVTESAIRDCTNGEREILTDLYFIQLVADRIAKSFSIDKACFRPKHGPGAVSEKYRESKYEFPTWPRRLENQFPFCEYGILNYGVYDPVEYCPDSIPAKLIHVPKTYKGPRLIASEPICSQYIQQGIMQQVRKDLKRTPLRHCINFHSQEESKTMVLSASRSLSHSTIDLSSASDRLSCAVVESIFRKSPDFLKCLNAARTPDITVFDGSVLRMKKFAAQGAAFTFPIQSIVYAIVCVGVLQSMNTKARLSDLCRKVRVYGDDMIVPTDCFSRVCNVLEALQLKVNPEKSFSKGLFRESCGMDAYWGTDVTPASILTFFNSRDRVNSVVSAIECSNNLYLKGFIRTSLAQQDTIPMGIRRRFPWVSHDSTTLGFVGSGQNCSLRTRYNQYWHTDEVQIFVVESKVKKTSPKWAHRILQWFIENPLPDAVWQPGEVQWVKARYCLQWVPRHRLGSGK